MVGALALSLAACGSDPGAETPGGEGSEGATGLSGELNGGGASSQESAMEAWRAGFQSANPDVTVNYDPTGSGGGRENFISGAFAFAGSDSALDEDEMAAAEAQCGEGGVIEYPGYISPVAVAFNLEGIDTLNMSGETIAKIFNGDITAWDDEAIAADNPDADLPSEDITPVHRSDESGTTGNFTNYLSTVAGDAWTFGEIEQWPNEAGGEGGKGTSGVVQVVTDAPNTIGYADASQAGGLGQANIGVGEEFVAPSAEAAAKIFEVSPRVDEGSAVNMAYDLDYTTEEAGVYPIVLTSYMVACETYDDEATAANVKGYLSYVLSDEGQEIGQSEAGSAPLTDTVISEAQAIVETISAG